MNFRFLPALLIVSISLFSSAQRAKAETAAPDLPPPAEKRISFGKDVKVILAHNCFECHGGGKKKGGLDLSSKDAVLKGGKSGPAIVSAKSAASELIKRLVSKDPDEVMPQKKPRLTNDEIAILRAWIDQGMVWDEAVIDRSKRISVAPRKVSVPVGGANAIDALLTVYFTKNKVAPAQPVDDIVFARRVYLDVTGLLPTPQQMEEFATDKSADRRTKLIQKVLGDVNGYSAHWITFWSDVLRNGTTLAGIDGYGNVNITPWLDNALKTNMPYNQFVAELLSGKKETEPFLKGVRMRGEIPASQTPEMQAAQAIGQAFLGIQLKCASCHDSFVSRFTLEDAYGLASVFSDKPLEMVRCEVPQGRKAGMKFLYPEVGVFEPTASRPERLKRLGELMTKKENGQFARTIVNRLWSKLLGRGLVEPVDEMENPAWNADVLDFLAYDLMEHNFDLKQTMALILQSNAYQLPSSDAKKEDRNFVFRGPLIKRLTAEQYVDGVYATLSIGKRSGQEKSTSLIESLGRPDRNTVATTRDTDSSTLQALELMNGPDLQRIVYSEGGKRIQDLLTETKGDKKEFAARIFQLALTRKPTDKELQAIETNFPSTLNKDTAADLIYTVFMLPEYQLVR